MRPEDAYERTRQSYTENADAYRTSTQSFCRYPGLEHELNDFASCVRDNGPILEIGTGSGRDLNLLARAGRVIATDRVLPFLTPLAGSFDVIQLDATCLPFVSSSISAVWCSAVLVHLDPNDCLLALREIRRVLTSDGVAGVSIKLGNNIGSFVADDVVGERWFYFYSRAKFEQLLLSANLRVFDHRARAVRDNQWFTAFVRPD